LQFRLCGCVSVIWSVSEGHVQDLKRIAALCYRAVAKIGAAHLFLNHIGQILKLPGLLLFGMDPNLNGKTSEAEF
jgi:hypothetical protein